MKHPFWFWLNVLLACNWVFFLVYDGSQIAHRSLSSNVWNIAVDVVFLVSAVLCAVHSYLGEEE